MPAGGGMKPRTAPCVKQDLWDFFLSLKYSLMVQATKRSIHLVQLF